MATEYQTLEHCVACDSNQLFPVLDLGQQPLANNLLADRLPAPRYPLALHTCGDCWHSQLSVAVDPGLMFKRYLYLSGTSQTLRDYCDWFAQRATNRFGYAGSVLDVACNDGTQLNSFAKFGWQTQGIDPARNLVNRHEHDVVVDFCENVDRPFFVDLITAQNVLAHTGHPVELLKKMKSWLKPHGEIQIQTSQANMFINGEFDTMYHEHVSFFSVSSMCALAERAGLTVTEVEFTPIHGTSYLFTLRHEGECVMPDQYDVHRYVPYTYKTFAETARTAMVQTKFAIDSYRRQGYNCIGYGAAAKGITFLNSAGIQLDRILEDNDWKCGRYTPGNLIPIYSADYNTKQDRDSEKYLFVILAWNFFDEIKAKITDQCYALGIKNASFITYFPEFRDEKLIG